MSVSKNMGLDCFKDFSSTRLQNSILGVVLVLLLMLILIGIYSVINWVLYVNT